MALVFLNVFHLQLHMLNTAAKLQHFLCHPVDALPHKWVQAEIDPQQYSRTLLLASQCVSEHWKELAQCLGINPHLHLDVLEESSDADEKCHGVSVLVNLCIWVGICASTSLLLDVRESGLYVLCTPCVSGKHFASIPLSNMCACK